MSVIVKRHPKQMDQVRRPIPASVKRFATKPSRLYVTNSKFAHDQIMLDHFGSGIGHGRSCKSGIEWDLYQQDHRALLLRNKFSDFEMPRRRRIRYRWCAPIGVDAYSSFMVRSFLARVKKDSPARDVTATVGSPLRAKEISLRPRCSHKYSMKRPPGLFLL